MRATGTLPVVVVVVERLGPEAEVEVIAATITRRLGPGATKFKTAKMRAMTKEEEG